MDKWTFPTLTLARYKKFLKQLEGEQVEVDSGYVGDSKVDHPNKNYHNLGQWISKYDDLRARHETVDIAIISDKNIGMACIGGRRGQFNNLPP
jgi:hypothetical protein